MGPNLRFAVDIGGTFTDLAIALPDGASRLYKSASTPADPVAAVLAVFDGAAADLGVDARELLARGALLIHGTTASTNAVVTGEVARTAFLTTEGHPDILLFREGGRANPFDFATPFPPPYVPRRLTFGVPGRIDAHGHVLTELNEDAVAGIISGLGAREVEAVGVCLLWSVVNPAHELRVVTLLDSLRPDLPYTVSRRLNPILREFRRASSTCIGASLKPLMADYLGSLEQRLRTAGFVGELVVRPLKAASWRRPRSPTRRPALRGGRGREIRRHRGRLRRHDVGQQFAPQQLEAAGPGCPGREHVVHRELREYRGPDDPADVGHDDHRERDHHASDPGPEDADQQQGQQHHREGEENVQAPHDHAVHQAAKVSRDHAEGDARQGGDEHREKTDQQRRAAAP